jgi:hypothetical protein
VRVVRDCDVVGVIVNVIWGVVIMGIGSACFDQGREQRSKDGEWSNERKK